MVEQVKTYSQNWKIFDYCKISKTSYQKSPNTLIETSNWEESKNYIVAGCSVRIQREYIHRYGSIGTYMHCNLGLYCNWEKYAWQILFINYLNTRTLKLKYKRCRCHPKMETFLAALAVIEKYFDKKYI